jgi:RNA-binding protein
MTSICRGLLQSVRMMLTETQKKFLRGLGHELKPTLIVADAGLSDAVMLEFDATITHHELIKVRIRAADRASRDAIISDLCNKGSAQLITRIGNVALVYRKNEDQPKIPVPL